MYRRIEIIQEFHTIFPDGTLDTNYYLKSGIMNSGSMEVTDAWCDKLKGPGRTIPWNARFYFTEKGWQFVGRLVVAACLRTGEKYRVIKIKESAIDVVFRDEYEVAGQPRRKWRKSGNKRRPTI